MIALALLFACLGASVPGFTVSGTVVHGITGSPLEKARVSIVPVEQRRQVRSVATGPDGRFRFDMLPEGKYSLYAERLGFARQSYGQRNLYHQYASAVVTGEGTNSENVVFRMIPGGVLTGYITDSRGDPVAGLYVQGMRLAGRGAHRRVQFVQQGGTDDRGYYRLHSLPAGDFAIAVTGRPWQRQETPSSEPVAYPVTYYPGTRNADDAGLIRVSPGRETRADIIVREVPAVQVDGTVDGPDSNDERMVVLTQRGPSGTEVPLDQPLRTYGSSFSIPDVPAGRYFLNLLDGDAHLLARRSVEVGSGAATVTIGEVPAATILAKVEIRGAPNGLEGQPIIVLRQFQGAWGVARPLDENGITFPPVPAGRYTILVARQRPMAVTSVRAMGATISGGILEVPETGSVELSIVVDASAVEVRGLVTKGQQPQAGVLVMLVPRQKWTDVEAFRFDQTDSDGTFTWPSVPPGEYLMFALEEGEPSDYMDTEVIRTLLPTARPITVKAGAPQTVTLELQTQ